MAKLKTITLQAFMINFFMVLFIGIECFIAYLLGDPINTQWYLPFSLILVSVLTAVPTLFLIKDGEACFAPGRLVLHGLSCYAIVMLAGYIFKWYTSLLYFGITSVIFIVIYVLVWVGSNILFRNEAAKINEALSKTHDED